MWKTLLPILLEVLKKYVGGWSAALFEKHLTPAPDEVMTAEETEFKGSSLTDFKLWLQSVIIEQINARVKRVVIRDIMVRMVKALDGAVLQFIWDMLARNGIVPAVKTAGADPEATIAAAGVADPQPVAVTLSVDERHFLQEDGITVS